MITTIFILTLRCKDVMVMTAQVNKKLINGHPARRLTLKFSISNLMIKILLIPQSIDNKIMFKAFHLIEIRILREKLNFAKIIFIEWIHFEMSNQKL